jgi:hemoglobin
MQTLYEQLGGEAAVTAAVRVFYQKVLDDDLTRPFFSDLDMEAQTRKQIAFMTWAFDGPVDYRGRDLRTAHAALVKRRGLNDSHFDAVARHLAATLKELCVPAALREEALRRVDSLRDTVLGR